MGERSGAMSEGNTYGLLLALLEPPEKMEEEFNEWYDQEHIPERKAIPGIITAQRFMAHDGSPKYLALYDLERLAVLEGEAYKRVGPANYSPWTRRINRNARVFIRETWSQRSPGGGVLSPKSGAIILWSFDYAENQRENFNGWFERACFGGLKDIGGYIQSRRFLRVEGNARELALIEFEDFGFLKSENYRSLLLSDVAVKARKAYGEASHKIYARYVPAAIGNG
jgi:hypothetical protein